MKKMFQNRVHLGHQTEKWNPKMKPYIYTKKNGTYIINLVQTSLNLLKTCRFLKKQASEGKTFLFVGTKKQVSSLIVDIATNCQSFYVNQRWLGGMLTNWKTISFSIKRLKKLEKKNFSRLPKKNAVSFEKQKKRLNKFFQGVKDLSSLPDVLIIVGQSEERNTINECKKLRFLKKKIKTITILDTDCDPTLTDFFIPANDDSSSSLIYILNFFKKSINEGKKKLNLKKN